MRPCTRSSFLVLPSFLLAIVVGCSAKQTSLSPTGTGAQAEARGDAKPCDRSDQDSSSVAHLPLYRQCAVEVKARPSQHGARPEFTPRVGDCVFVAIDIAVDTSGAPESGSERVTRTTDARFANAVLATIPTMRFTPARLDGSAVRQIFEVTVAMMSFREQRSAATGPQGPIMGRPAPCATRR